MKCTKCGRHVNRPSSKNGIPWGSMRYDNVTCGRCFRKDKKWKQKWIKKVISILLFGLGSSLLVGLLLKLVNV